MAAKAEPPAYDLYAVIDPDSDASEEAKSEWIKLGPLWKTKNADVLSGHINVLPLDAFSGRRLHIAVQRRKDKEDETPARGSDNRNRSRR